MSQDLHRDLLLAAALTWFHTSYRQIIDRIDAALRASRPGRVIEWRTDNVTDFRGHPVPASAERLVRWASDHPNDIFRSGFVPRYAAQPGDALADQFVNLSSYVESNVQSIFVSTARYYRNEANQATRWTPYNLRNRFEYEIFAYGGIDVNLSLGYHHRYFNQREIAFPGGIRPEFIRTAREYDANGRILRIWVNSCFDVDASGEAHSSRLNQLPDPVCGSRVPFVYWWGENIDPATLSGPSRERELRDVTSKLDVMEEDGQPAVDELGKDGTAPLPVKLISGDDAPGEGHEYAINLIGTTNVLTCTNSTSITVQKWHDAPTQRFRAVTYDGFPGFICKGAGGGSGRYVGYNASEGIVAQASYQRKWEHIFSRADPTGGFKLWMFKDEHLAPIMQVSPGQFKMMASSETRFGFTRLDHPAPSQTKHPDFWGLRPAGTDHPAEGHTYAIKIYGTNKAFTSVDSTEMALRDWSASECDTKQYFRCVTYDGFLGFICEGAGGCKGRYLGFDSSETLCCQAYYQRDWEKIDVRADPLGGFKLYMKKDEHLSPVAKVGADKMKMMRESDTRVSFTKVK